jgi:putative redox protein
MECTIDWQGPEGMLFISRTGSGHIVPMDGAPDGGGQNLAARPMEMVLVGAGGCAAYDVVLSLKRGRHAITGCQVKLTAERAETEPKVFTRIHYDFVVTGAKLPLPAVERAVELSKTKYCSAIAMLEKTAVITSSVTLMDSQAA